MKKKATKNIMHELSLPKELLANLIQNAKKSKVDFLLVIKEEVGKLISKIDMSYLLDEIVKKYDIDVHTTIRLRPKMQNDKTKQNKRKIKP